MSVDAGYPSLPESRRQRMRRRLRRFFLRHVPLTFAGATVLLILSLAGLYLYASSQRFQNQVRGRMAASLSRLTGGRVEIASFHWQLMKLKAEAGGIVIHGREAAGEAPYASIDRLRVQLSVLGFLSPRILLRDLEVERPRLHWIVYADGTTNQPEPRHKRRAGKPAIERLFDLKAAHIAITGGSIDYDNRAARFDFQNRLIPLDFRAEDASLRMSYVPAPKGGAEVYRIVAGATDLNLARGAGPGPPVHGRMEAVLDLARTAAFLRDMRVEARSRGEDQTLNISGNITNFSHPAWKFQACGGLDMRLLEPLTGYPFAPQGIARLNIHASGDSEDFRLSGPVHIDDGAYIGTGVVARGVTLDAQVQADPYELRITDVVARLQQGGELAGTVDLTHWLPPSPNAPHLEPAPFDTEPRPPASSRLKRDSASPLTIEAQNLAIPVDGRVTATLRNVTLDTILGMVSRPPFQRLGIAALLNGAATATWARGNASTVVVRAGLAVTPAPATAPGAAPPEAPANGVIDATYRQRDGGVAVHKFQLELPESTLAASGTLGAYPMTGATSLAVDFHSHNLSEFDVVLHDLGLDRGGRVGAAALPAKLAGQADFHGTWTGSLLRPRIAGELKATRLTVEMPVEDSAGRPIYTKFDTADVRGSYSGTQIAIASASLEQGAAHLSVSGTLDAAQPPGSAPAMASGQRQRARSGPRFDRDSILHAEIKAAKVSTADLQPFFSAPLPVSGNLDAQIEVHGPLGAVGGAGFLELTAGSLYGEPLTGASVRGSFQDHGLRLSAANLGIAGGTITGSGSFDFAARSFQARARANGIQLGRIGWIRRENEAVAGQLEFTLAGSGKLANPQLDAKASVSHLKLGGEALGGLDLTAQSSGDALHYEGKTLLAGAELHLNGKTELHGDFLTDDRLEFSRFDVGALLKMAHVQGLSGESSLAGAITMTGPLKRPEQLRGEAVLNTLALTLDGVHLEDQGGAHATLAGGRIRLDPIHVTGEDTDLRAQGTLAITGAHRFDAAGRGAINLKLAETLDPDLAASGTTTFEVEAHGTSQNPGLQGAIHVQNGDLSLGDLPNGLSQLHGTLEFNQNRLEVRQLTAMTGGGLLSVGGSLTYHHGLYADLSVTGKGVRIRYPQGVSSLADADLRLQGSETSLLLSGNVLITRFVASPELDLEALAAQANASLQGIAPPDSPSNHLRLDVHLVSSPQLNFQNAFAKLAGDVDLRLRGTLASPSVLGRVSITEGSAVIAGTRYELEQGEISFTNPVRIDPMVDLTATAHVEDYDITLGLHGSVERPNITYRSDPPLAESDVVSLLALGRTQDQERLYTQQQEQELANPSTDALLGGALNATVSSRVQKLFGAGSVKVDPDYLGAFGNATSRITVQEQLGRSVTLTYATDVNTTGQQLIQAEVAINRHVSLVVARDESGVFSMVLKTTRRYK